MMRRCFRLPALALTVWAAWLGLLAALAMMFIMRVWHPHFLPVTVLVLLLVIASVALLVGGLWRLVVGPRRLRALTWLLLGVAPLLFFASFVLYGLRLGYGRQLVIDLPLRMLVPFGESMFDLLARFQYPVRTGGETVVMISKPLANGPAQVAAMDRHVQALCKRLEGRPDPRRIHWVRGTLLGITPHGLNGLCLACAPGEEPAGAEGLTSLDRHEVAHCVLSSIVPADFDPPSVLSEGWAQANQGDNEKIVALRAWEHRESGEAIPLRELTGPFWYSRHQYPAYVQGAALVNHILRKYGPAKFMELYRTCRPATAAADFKSVLGVSLDDLDAAYWAEVKQMAFHEATPVARLRAFDVRPPVDRAAWNAFLDEYLAATKALIAPYDYVDMTIEFVLNGPDEHGKAVTSTNRFVERRSGELMALKATYSQDEAVFLATPARSLVARRKRKQASWEIADRPRDDPELSYLRVVRAIVESGGFSKGAALLLALAAEPQIFANESTWAVTKFERFTEGGRHMVRLRIEPTVARPAMRRPMTLVFNADDKLAVWSSDLELPNDTHLRGEYDYDHEGGVPLVRSYHFVVVGREGKVRDGSRRVVERRFGPVPASEFTEARLLDRPVVHKSPPSDEERYKDPRTFAEVYRFVLAGGVIALAAGLGCGVMGGFRRQPVPEPAAANV
jgi:hypothetical protein